MRHPRRLVLSGCLVALIVMNILSALVGWAAPNLISRKWTHHITTFLFLGFGLWSLKDAIFEEGDAEELAEVEAKLDKDWKAKNGATKDSNKRQSGISPIGVGNTVNIHFCTSCSYKFVQFLSVLILTNCLIKLRGFPLNNIWIQLEQ